LAGFLDRVDEVEANPLCLHVVTEAVLFGRMLDPGRQTVSDVDVALDLVRDEVKVRALGLSDPRGRTVPLASTKHRPARLPRRQRAVPAVTAPQR
jgi:hypothetical protein